MATVTGNNLYLNIRYIKNNHGKEILEQILDLMPKEYAQELRKPILSGRRYDLKIMQSLYDVVEKKLGKNVIKMMAYDAANKQLKGLYGLIIKFVNLDNLLPKAQMLWDKGYSEGKLDIRKDENISYIATVTGLHMSDSHILGFMFWLEAAISIILNKKLVSRFEKINDYSVRFFITPI